MAEVTAHWMPPVSAVCVTAWPGTTAALAARLRDALGLELAAPGCWTASGEIVCVWLGPDRWQIEHADRPDLARQLSDVTGGLGGAIEMSDARVVLSVAGEGSREVLARLLPLDLHPRAFGPGRTAATVAAHISVYVRQIDSVPTWQIACPRGYAESFAHAVATAGAVLR